MLKIFPEKLPDKILLDRKYRAEREVFEKLNLLPKDSSYSVYYSIWWANDNPQINRDDGECDFIITHPFYGFLFIEVKGGNIKKTGNQWYQNERQIGDPMLQAMSSKKVMLEKMKSTWDEKYSERMPYIEMRHAAIFPNSKRKDEYLSTHIEHEMLGFEKDLSGDIGALVNQLFNYNKGRKPLSKNHHIEQQKVIEIFDEMVVTNFDFSKSWKDFLRDWDKEINGSIKNMTSTYDSLSDNSKILIGGPAGSGKTLVGLHAAEKRSKKGDKVLFTCFNRPLSHWLENQLSHFENIEVRTFHSLCAKLINDCVLEHGSWDENSSKLLANLEILPKKYDFIIIDEVQDFDDEWLAIVRATGKESFQEMLLCDYNQMVWSKPRLGSKQHAKFNLTNVLRSTQHISISSKAYYHGDDFKCLGPMGDEIDCESSLDDCEKIIGHVESLIGNGIETREIAILTDFHISEEIKVKLESSGLNFYDAENNENGITLDTISRFKGLESPIVILWFRKSKLNKELMYVGITRARTHLIVVAPTVLRESIISDFGNQF